MPGAEQRQTDPEALERLNVGSKVVLQVLQLLPSGPANQFQALVELDSNARRDVYIRKADQAGRLWQSVEIDRTTGRYRRTQAEGMARVVDIVRPGRIAGAALKYGSGYCQEFAALAFVLLQQNLSNRSEIWLVKGQGPHYYCIVTSSGTPRDKNSVPGDAVVVDPWIIGAAKAAFWRDAVHEGTYPPETIYSPMKGAASSNRTARGLETDIIETVTTMYENIQPDTVRAAPERMLEERSPAALQRQLAAGRVNNIWDDATLLNPLGAVRAEIQSYSQKMPRVKHGTFAGQMPRPLRELHAILSQPRVTKADIEQAKRIARTMGKHHPILEALNKVDIQA